MSIATNAPSTTLPPHGTITSPSSPSSTFLSPQSLARRPRCVIVGGGYSGSKLACFLDSLFHVTLIDTKNYVDYTPDVVNVIGSPWSAEKEAFLDRELVLHRFFLKHANVVLGRVTHYSSRHVILTPHGTGTERAVPAKRESVVVPFDILVFATGRWKPLPFGTLAHTKKDRISELRNVCTHISRNEIQSIGVFGAGPIGCSLAVQLAQSYPQKHITLYARSATPTPRLLHSTQAHVREVLEAQANVTVHWDACVEDVRPGKKRNDDASDVGGFDVTVQHVVREYAAPLEDGSTLRTTSTLAAGSRRRSVLHQLLYGSNGGSLSTEQETFPLRDAALLGSGTTLSTTKRYAHYDAVFHCTGFLPYDPPKLLQEGDDDTSNQSDVLLDPHVDAGGRFRVTRFHQLFGMPHVFAIGSCSNLPWVNSYIVSDVQAQVLFRLFHKMLTSSGASTANSVSAQPTTNPYICFQASDAIRADRMRLPRLVMHLGSAGKDAFGSTAWDGDVRGSKAMQEYILQKRQLFQRFTQPVFYKQRDAAFVWEAFTRWKQRERTDVQDFNVFSAVSYE